MAGVGALRGAVALWVAGFDLFYSLFDLEHDRAAGPALVGGALRRAWRVRRRARLLHVGTVALLAAAGLGLDVDVFVLARRRGASLRCSPTSTRSCGPGDLRRLDAAFFTVNGVISVVFFVLRRWPTCCA